MGVKTLLGRLAVRRAHVLTVELPGYWTSRVRLEQAIAARGWRSASSPADADVLAVCGAPSGEWSDLIDRIWDQLPGPRTRIDVTDPEDVGEALDEAVAALRDDARQRADARDRPVRPEVDEPDMDHSHMDHGSHEDTNHADMDHSQMDHSSHGDMDHGNMDHSHMGHGDMAPEGIPLAGGADDRDGLEMDVLRVRLGPVLAHWPAGLVLDCTLAGDVLTDVDGRFLDGGDCAPHRGGAHPAARHCDHAADLLALAGLPTEAATAQRCRDLLVDGARGEQVIRLLRRLHRRVSRSRLLRWSLRDLAALDPVDVQRLGLSAAWAGDTFDRLVERLRVAAVLAAGELESDPFEVAADVALGATTALVDGLDLAAARLVIAGLGLDAGTPVVVGPA